MHLSISLPQISNSKSQAPKQSRNETKTKKSDYTKFGLCYISCWLLGNYIIVKNPFILYSQHFFNYVPYATVTSVDWRNVFREFKHFWHSIRWATWQTHHFH